GRVVANGGLSYEEACRKLESEEIVHGMPDWSPLRKDWAGLYGCTMNIRRAAVVAEPFDERLPLYAIGEDTEIGFRLRRFGRIGGSARCIIIHLAASSGRVTEKGVGYAQIINFIYYAHKGIGFPFWPTYYERLVRVPLANLLFTCFPKRDKSTNCDRRGRLLGNCIAFRDLLLGRVQPERLLKVLGKA
ncbi:MAG: glycosyltransferase family 2 protein, partial [Verrucomicrobiota bacterium]